MNVHPFIEAEKQAGHSVKRACELLKVSRAAFYARRTGTPGPRAVRDAELTGRISEVRQSSRGTYGAPRIHAALRGEGTACGRRRVVRLIRAAGLTGRHRPPRHRTTVPDPAALIRPDLVARDFQPDPTAADNRWCGDITYVPTEEGWLYLATVIDIATRRVVGWATADHLRTSLVADALRAACHQRRPPARVIFHSDRGCQYTSREFAALAQGFGIRLSVGRTGQCWDNALAESFFATLKRELPCDRPWPSRATARTAIFEWIESWYNLKRLHSSLGLACPLCCGRRQEQIRKLEQDLDGELLVRGGVKHPMQLTSLGKKVVAAAAPYTDQSGDLHGPRHKPKALAAPEPRQPAGMSNGESGPFLLRGPRGIWIMGGGVLRPRRGARSRADGRTRRRVRPGGRGCGTSWGRPRGPSPSRRRECSPRGRSRGRA
ncbi:IS3 family transposase [Streptomyces sp. SB3404]|uniref:IS3 family transposase n=1 Tax=Streptomyces boncukensis TaxID=2711219 RepID=A0A6G4X1C1_9ACTN|nr:IS3 family transposase [Streptomyces boncukensis]